MKFALLALLMGTCATSMAQSTKSTIDLSTGETSYQMKSGRDAIVINPSSGSSTLVTNPNSSKPSTSTPISAPNNPSSSSSNSSSSSSNSQRK